VRILTEAHCLEVHVNVTFFCSSAYELHAESDEDHNKAAPVGSAHSQATPENGAPKGWIQVLFSVVPVFAIQMGTTKWGIDTAGSPRVRRTEAGICIQGGTVQAFSRKDVKVHFVGAWYVIFCVFPTHWT
jgi:hypothetical protein